MNSESQGISIRIDSESRLYINVLRSRYTVRYMFFVCSVFRRYSIDSGARFMYRYPDRMVSALLVVVGHNHALEHARSRIAPAASIAPSGWLPRGFRNRPTVHVHVHVQLLVGRQPSLANLGGAVGLLARAPERTGWRTRRLGGWGAQVLPKAQAAGLDHSCR